MERACVTCKELHCDNYREKDICIGKVCKLFDEKHIGSSKSFLKTNNQDHPEQMHFGMEKYNVMGD
jgi:hypothetical protein